MSLKEKGPPNLAERLLDLRSIGLPETSYDFVQGKELIFRTELSPSTFSRTYACELHVRPGKAHPSMIIVAPDLYHLAGGRKVPHIYPYAGKGVRLCLWTPRLKEWNWHMKLSDTYIPWTLRWLWYFEDWLQSDDWVGGGTHPETTRRRFGRGKRLRSERVDASE
jgi:hypothetical protein